MSGARYRTLFVVGCPRSGTTWVQLLLNGSPEIATAPETQIFAYYLDGFRRQWIEEHEGKTARLQGRAGLSRLLSDEEFRELCALCARYVLDRISQRNPAASVVLEKSPRHAVLMEWVLEILPDAHVLHVVRDPRDAVASIMEAGRSWGAGWAPKNPIVAARMWKSQVEGARRAAELTDSYREVRYEDLRTRPVEELRNLLRWLGLEADSEACAQAVASCRLERLRGDGDGEAVTAMPTPAARSPRGFFGEGAVGEWRSRLSERDARIVESICFHPMRSLGYEPELVDRPGRSARMVAHDMLRRFGESVEWQIERLLTRV